MLACQSVRLIHLLWSSQAKPTNQEHEQRRTTRQKPSSRADTSGTSSVLRVGSSTGAVIPTIIVPVPTEGGLQLPTLPNSVSASSFYSIDLSTVPSTPALCSDTSSQSSSPISPCWLPTRETRYLEPPKDEKAIGRVLFPPSSRQYDCMISDLDVAPIALFTVQDAKEIRQEKIDRDSADSGYTAHKFEWKHGGSTVKVTGTFDNWEKTITMERSAQNKDHFEATVTIDRSRKVLFKYVVDGDWKCAEECDTELDQPGNMNNVLPSLSA